MGLEKPYIFTVSKNTTVDEEGNVTLVLASGEDIMQAVGIFDIEIQ
jgi:hypothetical protein